MVSVGFVHVFSDCDSLAVEWREFRMKLLLLLLFVSLPLWRIGIETEHSCCCCCRRETVEAWSWREKYSREMASFTKSNKAAQRIHKERHQLAERAHLGVLEKRKVRTYAVHVERDVKREREQILMRAKTIIIIIIMYRLNIHDDISFKCLFVFLFPGLSSPSTRCKPKTSRNQKAPPESSREESWWVLFSYEECCSRCRSTSWQGDKKCKEFFRIFVCLFFSSQPGKYFLVD